MIMSRRNTNQYLGGAVGAVAGGILFGALLGGGVVVGAFYGALMGYMAQVLVQNWVPFDFKALETWQPQESEWKKPGHAFDNSVAAETGEQISNRRMAKFFAPILALLFFGLMIGVILLGDDPSWLL